MRPILLLLIALCAAAADPWVTYAGGDGPGKGRRIVIVTGEPIYRSEESMPQLARILAVRHGFTCTVLFATRRDSGEIDPQTLDHLPGLEQLELADLLILFCRSRELADADMARFAAYRASGKPILALRTATHPFAPRKDGPYAGWRFDAKGGGFGREVLGETWIAHLGRHKSESTRGILVDAERSHPVLRGVADVWGPSDVYALGMLPADCRVLLLGRLLTGLAPHDPPREDKPAVPVAWTRELPRIGGPATRVLTTTMGHAGDLENDGFRRLLVNGCYWCLGMEGALPATADVTLVGEYLPNPIGHGGHKRGILPAAHAWPATR